MRKNEDDMLTERKKSNPFVWWELRRIPFNIVFVIIAEISVQLIHLFADVGPTEEAIHPFTLLAIIAVLNVVYTFCWITEIGNRRSNNDRLDILKGMFYVSAGFMMISPVLNFFRFVARILFQ